MHSDGLEPKSQRVLDANLLMTRSAILAKVAMRGGAWFSIENPALSYAWEYSPIKTLSTLPGVSWHNGAQCRFGCAYVKATGWLTNAPWMSFLVGGCPGQPEHVRHPVWEGKATLNGRRVWKTELAAEYPEGLCDAISVAYASAVRDKPEIDPPQVSVNISGVTNPIQGPSNKQRKETDAAECVGGLRDPASSVIKVPGLASVGKRTRAVLEPLLNKYAAEFSAVLDTLGQVHATEVPESVVLEARKLLRHEFRTEIDSLDFKNEAKDGLQGWLYGGLLKASDDPETQVPKWLEEKATPLGILRPIIPSGVFPRVDPQGVGPKLEKFLPTMEAKLGSKGGNYSSYRDKQEAADGQIKSEYDAGYLDWNQSRHVLECQFGELVLSKMACLVSEKDGRVKI